MGFTVEQVKDIREDMQKALETIEGKYGIKVDVGDIRYEELTFTAKVIVRSNEVFSEEFEREEFERLCHVYGLEPADYKRRFKLRKKRSTESFELVGFEIGRYKYPIRGRSAMDGRILLFTRDVLERLE